MLIVLVHLVQMPKIVQFKSVQQIKQVLFDLQTVFGASPILESYVIANKTGSGSGCENLVWIVFVLAPFRARISVTWMFFIHDMWFSFRLNFLIEIQSKEAHGTALLLASLNFLQIRIN